MQSRMYAVAVLIVALSGCSSPTAPDNLSPGGGEVQTFDVPVVLPSALGDVVLTIFSMSPPQDATLTVGQNIYLNIKMENNTGGPIWLWATVVSSPSWNSGKAGERGPFDPPCSQFEPGVTPSGEATIAQLGGMVQNRDGVPYNYLRVLISHDGCSGIDDAIDGFYLGWK